MQRAPGEAPVGHIMQHHAAAQMTDGSMAMCVCVCEAAKRVIINNPVELKDRGEHWQALVCVSASMTLYGYMFCVLMC